MADKQLERLFELMPDIATVVNRFESPAVQVEVFWILVMATDVDLEFVDLDHPALNWNAWARWGMRPWVGLSDLVGEERLSEAYERLREAEAMAMEPHFAEKALSESVGVDELRELAARAARGELVSLRKL